MKPIFKQFRYASNLCDVYMNIPGGLSYSHSGYGGGIPCFYIEKSWSARLGKISSEDIKNSSIVHGTIEEFKQGKPIVVRSPIVGFTRDVLKEDITIEGDVYPRGTAIFYSVEHNGEFMFDGKLAKVVRVTDNFNYVIKLLN